MSGEKCKNVHCVKHLGVTIASNLKFSQQCRVAASKANRKLGFIKKSFKNKDIVIPLYNRLFRPYSEYEVQFWSPVT